MERVLTITDVPGSWLNSYMIRVKQIFLITSIPKMLLLRQIYMIIICAS